MFLKAVCAYVPREDGQILAVSRKDNPNAFGLPGGKIDPGETPIEAIIREMKEETGLDFVKPELTFVGMCPGGQDGVEYLTYCFNGVILGEVNTTEKGVVSFVSEQTLLDGPFGVYNERLFDFLKEIQNVKSTRSLTIHQGRNSHDTE